MLLELEKDDVVGEERKEEKKVQAGIFIMKLPHLFYLNNFNEKDSIEQESDMEKKER